MMAALSRTDGPTPVETGLSRELATRLIQEQPVAVAGHLLVILVVTAVMWEEAARPALTIWALVVTATCALRGFYWRYVRDHSQPETLLPRLRLISTVVALAWGVGGALLTFSLAPQDVALLLLVVSGLVAAATGTLSADLISFRLFALAQLAPFPLALLSVAQVGV